MRVLKKSDGSLNFSPSLEGGGWWGHGARCPYLDYINRSFAEVSKYLKTMAKAEPFIGLEVTSKKIRLVELVTLPTGIEVTNFAVLELPQGGLKYAGSQLQSLLQEKNFHGKKVNALLYYPSIDYLQVPLPPMREADLSLAAAREAKKDLK